MRRSSQVKSSILAIGLTGWSMSPTMPGLETRRVLANIWPLPGFAQSRKVCRCFAPRIPAYRLHSMREDTNWVASTHRQPVYCQCDCQRQFQCHCMQELGYCYLEALRLYLQ